MFERFTGRARRAVVSAQEEAGRLNHNYIGTEHVLLGLLSQQDSIAATVLGEFGVTLDSAREEVEAVVGLGKSSRKGHIPFTPRAKKTLELSLREALRLGHNYIGTEHILLGLIREQDGVAAKILADHGDLNDIKAAVVARVPPPATEETDPLTAATAGVMRRIRDRFASGGGRGGGEDIADEPAMRATPAANATLAEAARLAGPGALGSHHLLLAALADANSAAALALTSLGVDLDQVRERLRGTDVTGTSDESPEEAGRRQMTVEVGDGKVTVVLTDPVIVAAGEAALRAVAESAAAAGESGSEPASATVIRGDQPAAAGLTRVWTELRTALGRIQRAAALPPAG